VFPFPLDLLAPLMNAAGAASTGGASTAVDAPAVIPAATANGPRGAADR